LRKIDRRNVLSLTFRISTMGDPVAQLRRLTEEVLPSV